ncbi:MAG: hypothetical protein IJU56_03270 [Clostridia bacterium]|nr:hypothetical protein [Clostridia bacterium]
MQALHMRFCRAKLRFARHRGGGTALLRSSAESKATAFDLPRAAHGAFRRRLFAVLQRKTAKKSCGLQPQLQRFFNYSSAKYLIVRTI